MSVITVWPIRLIGLVIAILIIWGSLSYRLGGRVPGDFYDVGWNSAPAAWQVPPPSIWLGKSLWALNNGNFSTAETYALKALQAENFNGVAFAQLITIYDRMKQPQRAEQVLALASEYSPARARVRAHIAGHWLQHKQWDKVIAEWGNMLTRVNNGEMRSALYPNMLQLIQYPNGFTLFEPVLLTPPAWWDGFYSYLLREKVDTTLLQSIYQVRSTSEVPLSTSERRLFVNRLLQEKQWNDAYFLWLSGQDEKTLPLSGLIFDGGFEGNSFNSGFDWQISRPRGVRIVTMNTSGVSGRRALRVLFNNKKINFRHLSQRLNLAPGKYFLNYRYRLNRLKNPEGLSWRIRCTGGSANSTTPIMESKALKGRSPWTDVSDQFTVPADCPLQLLRLESSSRFSHNHTFKGSVWFDDFKITRDLTTTAEQN